MGPKHVSLHRGAENLLDLKRIISPYTKHPENLVPVINDLTLKKEFIILDLRRSKDDSLSIRVRMHVSYPGDRRSLIAITELESTPSAEFACANVANV